MALVRACHRYARISPTKVRPFTEVILGQTAAEGLDTLRYVPNRGARMLEKVLRSVIANAEERDADVSTLFISESRVDEGPTIKRFQPKDRGRAHPIRKRTCHLHIVLNERG